MHYQRFRILCLTLLPALVLLTLGCKDETIQWPAKPGPKVVASFPPIYSMAAKVLGDRGSIRSVMSSHGPHHFDPTAQDARLLAGADYFVINGLGLDERIATRLKDGSGNRQLLLSSIGSKIDPSELEFGECLHDEHDHAHDHDHAIDPHVWLGLDLVPVMVDTIASDLQNLDAEHAQQYQANAANFKKEVQELLAYGQQQFKDKKTRKFVSFHESLTYFARCFDLEVAAVIQSTPGKEPAAKEMEQLVANCLEHKINVIAVEPQYSAQLTAKRIVEELRRKGMTDVTIVELDPMETANEKDLSPDWYLNKMRQNIDTLARAMK